MDTKQSKLKNNFTAVKINEAIEKRIWKVSEIRHLALNE